MVNEILLLYVLTRLDNVLIFSGWVVAIYVVIYFGSLIRWSESYGEDEKTAKLFVNKVVSKWYIPVLALLMFVVIPSKEDAGIILAGTGVIEAAKNETTQRIAGKSVQVIEQFLDEMLKKEK